MNVMNIKTVLSFLDMLDPSLTLWKLNWTVKIGPFHKTNFFILMHIGNDVHGLQGTVIGENRMFIIN